MKFQLSISQQFSQVAAKHMVGLPLNGHVIKSKFRLRANFKLHFCIKKKTYREWKIMYDIFMVN